MRIELRVEKGVEAVDLAGLLAIERERVRAPDEWDAEGLAVGLPARNGFELIEDAGQVREFLRVHGIEHADTRADLHVVLDRYAHIVDARAASLELRDHLIRRREEGRLHRNAVLG